MNKLTLLATDASGNKTGELDGFAEFTAIPRFNAIGKWLLKMDYTQDQAALLDRYAGIALELDGDIVFSGPVAGIHREGIGDKDLITISGTDDMGLLAGRLALPVPGGPPYTSAEFDVRTGYAETVIKEYVAYNCGPLARASRMIPGLTIPVTQQRGSAVTGRARFDKLVGFLVNLAAIGGIGLRCVNQVFDCYFPADLSAPVILSKALGTLGDFSYEFGLPDVNFIFVGGSGTGTSRAITELGDSQSILDWRIQEAFLDASKTSVVAELMDAGTAELGKKAGASKFSVSSIAMPGREPLVDYGLGDRIKAVIDGVSLTMIAAEFEISLTKDGAQKVKPTFSAGAVPVGLLRNFDTAVRTRQDVDLLQRK